LAPLKHVHLGSFFLEPDDIESQTLGGHLAPQQGGRAPVSEVMGHKGPVSFIGLGASGLEGPEPSYWSKNPRW
jgi:hypothetical protein